jgi:hypothetical protein
MWASRKIKSSDIVAIQASRRKKNRRLFALHGDG